MTSDFDELYVGCTDETIIEDKVWNLWYVSIDYLVNDCCIINIVGLLIWMHSEGMSSTPRNNWQGSLQPNIIIIGLKTKVSFQNKIRKHKLAGLWLLEGP